MDFEELKDGIEELFIDIALTNDTMTSLYEKNLPYYEKILFPSIFENNIPIEKYFAFLENDINWYTEYRKQRDEAFYDKSRFALGEWIIDEGGRKLDAAEKQYKPKQAWLLRNIFPMLYSYDDGRVQDKLDDYLTLLRKTWAEVKQGYLANKAKIALPNGKV